MPPWPNHLAIAAPVQNTLGLVTGSRVDCIASSTKVQTIRTVIGRSIAPVLVTPSCENTYAGWMCDKSFIPVIVLKDINCSATATNE